MTPDDVRIAVLERRLNRTISLLDATVESIALVLNRVRILQARLIDLETKSEISKHTNDLNDDDESRRLATELLAEARAFGKPN